MAHRARHVLSTPGEVRVQVKFRRRDLLYRHLADLHDPHAAAKLRKARAAGVDVNKLRQRLTVSGLPMQTENGNLVGPTLLDMLVRQVWSFTDLPPSTQKALKRRARNEKTVTPLAVVAWSVRDLASLWPRPGEKQSLPRSNDANAREREFDHPFLARLASGGQPGYSGVGEWVTVHKFSTCQINEHIYRVAVGVFGGLDAAYRRIAGMAIEAWEADLERALQLWELVRAAPDEVLVEDDSVAMLRPICSISQEVERAVMREVCDWLGIDPELPIKREPGRPKAPDAVQGEVLRVELRADGTTHGKFLIDYEGIAAESEFHELALGVLVSALGALRRQGLDTDATLLEAWLDAAIADWRERVASDGDSARDAPSSMQRSDPYEVLGVERTASMPAIVAAYRRAVKAVHPDVSGASDWLFRAVTDAYKQIRAERKAEEEGMSND